jgi:hypothetical protein
MRHLGASGLLDRVRRGWFAETLVVLGIIAFAFFAMTLQGQQAIGAVPAIPALLEIG